jgi:hypothetical protein
MSAFPDKCREIHDEEAYKKINRRLVGNWVKLQFTWREPREVYHGQVVDVIQGRSTKEISIATPDGQKTFTVHGMCKMTIKRYRNESHYKSELNGKAN